MRTAITLLFGVALGSTLTFTAMAQPSLLADEATTAAVSAVKRAIVEGHRTKDRAALAALYADDYTALDTSGTVRRKRDLLDGLATDPEMAEGRYALTRVRRWGDIAVASGHGRMVYRTVDGTTRVSEYDSVNVFEQRHGKWWYVAAFLP